MPENFMGMDGFVWFVGVVEDRVDPEEIGRVRVRCLGFHTEDLTKLPTADLPWAHVMHPVTDPAWQGVGNSPSFLLEGSWVVGFFRDAESKQQPVIIGSLPGVPQKEADPTKGFSDPRGPKSIQEGYKEKDKIPTGSYMSTAVIEEKAKWPTHYYGPYPLKGDEKTLRPPLEEPDTSMLARGQKAEEHDSLRRRRKTRTLDVPIARKPTMGATEANAKQENQQVWNEPLPRGVEAKGKKTGTEVVKGVPQLGIPDTTKDKFTYQAGLYPYNHVFESEAGHIMETDDTPGGERLYRQHMTGTMEEIHPDGKKVVVVIGDNYEIVAGKSNILIKGDCNVTVEGTKREYIKGDYVLQVDGEYTENIGKDMKSKIGAISAGNRLEEVIGNYGYNIAENMFGTIGKNVRTNIGGGEKRIIDGVYTSSQIATGAFMGYILNVRQNISVASVTGNIGIVTQKAPIAGGGEFGNIFLHAEGHFLALAKKVASIQAVSKIELKSDAEISINSVYRTNMRSGLDTNIQSNSGINITSGAVLSSNNSATIELNKSGIGWQTDADIV